MRQTTTAGVCHDEGKTTSFMRNQAKPIDSACPRHPSPSQRRRYRENSGGGCESCRARAPQRGNWAALPTGVAHERRGDRHVRGVRASSPWHGDHDDAALRRLIRWLWVEVREFPHLARFLGARRLAWAGGPWAHLPLDPLHRACADAAFVRRLATIPRLLDEPTHAKTSTTLSACGLFAAPNLTHWFRIRFRTCLGCGLVSRDATACATPGSARPRRSAAGHMLGPQ
jgi:hypothetical protein